MINVRDNGDISNVLHKVQFQLISLPSWLYLCKSQSESNGQKVSPLWNGLAANFHRGELSQEKTHERIESFESDGLKWNVIAGDIGSC